MTAECMLKQMSKLNNVLAAVERGDPCAAERLLPLVYAELRSLAAVRMAAEAPGHTLQPTALVHEAYLRLISADPTKQWDGRGHFFAAAAEAMRRILIDAARHRRAGKHGGDHRRVELLDAELAIDSGGDDLFAVDDALARLAGRDPQIAQLVKLRFFAGLTTEEAAAGLGIPIRTAYRHWAYARAWLRRELDRA